MLKKYSIVNFVLLIIIALLGILLSVCPFNVPASTDKYNGFVNAIEKGIDLNGGVSAIYSAELDGGESNLSLTETIDASIEKVENVFSHNGDFPELFVTRQGDKVRVEVSGVSSTDSVFGYLADGQSIYVTLEEVSDDVTNPKVYLDSDDISYAYVGYDYDNSNYTVVLEFTNIGRSNLENILTSADEIGSSNAYVYIESLDADNLLSDSINVSDIDGNISFALNSSSDYYSTSTTTYSNGSSQARVSYIITGGALGLDLTLLETSEISPILGENTLLFLGIASIATIVLAFVALIVKYRDLGLLGCLSLIFYLIIFVFFMQAIPFVVLNLATMFGCIFAFALAIIANVIIFEKVREEYALGKKIHLSFKGGMKKALWPILDSHIVLALVSMVIWIFAPSYLKGFGIVLLMGCVVSVFISLVVTRYLLNIYLPLNSTKSKRLGLVRDKSVKELKDDQSLNNVSSLQINEQTMDNQTIDSQSNETIVTETEEGGNNND